MGSRKRAASSSVMVLVLLIYPKRAWQDAPLFPTPREALQALPSHVSLSADARILDALAALVEQRLLQAG